MLSHIFLSILMGISSIGRIEGRGGKISSPIFYLSSNKNLSSEESSIGVKIDAESGILVNGKTNQVLFTKNADKPLSIASITKLMTALVFLDYNPGWDKEIKILAEDYRSGAKAYLETGEIVRVKDIFYTALVGSVNSAAVALSRSTGLTPEEFAEKMNQKAKDLGMNSAHFEESTGLDSKNAASAYDIAKLAMKAFLNPDIKKALQTDEYNFYSVDGKNAHNIKNTDKLLNSFLDKGEYKIMGAKTGYTEEAKYCLALGVEDKNNSMFAVVLGTNTPGDRFQEAKSLVWWGFQKINKIIN